jgi:5-methylcytosine-specific restriction endonuclease McrA/GNAT superfamily N-acetyltransferase
MPPRGRTAGTWKMGEMLPEQPWNDPTWLAKQQEWIDDYYGLYGDHRDIEAPYIPFIVTPDGRVWIGYYAASHNHDFMVQEAEQELGIDWYEAKDSQGSVNFADREYQVHWPNHGLHRELEPKIVAEIVNDIEEEREAYWKEDQKTAGLWEQPSQFQIPHSVEQAFVRAMECPHCHSNLLLDQPPPKSSEKVYCPVCGWKPREWPVDEAGRPYDLYAKTARHVDVEIRREADMPFGSSAEVAREMQEMYNLPEYFIYNAYDDGKFVGTVFFFPLEDKTLLSLTPNALQEPVVWVEYIHVDRAYRDSDLFFQLAKIVKDYAEQLGLPIEAYYQNERLKQVVDRYFQRAAAAPMWNINTPRHIDPNPKGMPRPLYQNLPVPWTSDIEIPGDPNTVVPNFSVADPHKIYECWKSDLCVLCGEPLDNPVAVIPTTKDFTPAPGGDQISVLDGPLHLRCAKMTKAHCPHIRDGGFEVWTMSLEDWHEGKPSDGPEDYYVAIFNPEGFVRVATEFDTPPLANPVTYQFTPFTENEYEMWRALDQETKDRYRRKARTVNRRVQRLPGMAGTVTGSQLWMLTNRYQNKCAYCGQEGPDSFDHVVPLSEGGQNTIDNLLPAHMICNQDLNDWQNRNKPYQTPTSDQMADWWKSEPAEAKVSALPQWDYTELAEHIFNDAIQKGLDWNQAGQYTIGQLIEEDPALTREQASNFVVPIADNWLKFYEQIQHKDEKGQIGEDAPYDVQWEDMIPDLPGRNWELIAPRREGAWKLAELTSWRKLEPHQELRDLAQSYMDGKRWPYNPPRTYPEVDESRAKRIADEYDRMPHTPNDPYVRSAYMALANETKDQYEHLINNGYRFEFEPEGGAYNSPWDASRDVRENKHLYVYPTSAGFGSTDETDHPLLADSGYTWNDQPVTYNDLFRGVHDVFGHAKEGVGFRHHGEENAWRQHSAMYSDMARHALTSETRGQNSWVNFGPYGEHNQTADQTSTVYAPQKAGLLPEWATWEGVKD